MKNIKTVLILSLLLVIVIGVTGTASAATINFQASDPADTTNANFDIISFGATPNGDNLNFWIQVRGNIDINPPSGYMNAYVIDIYGNEDYEIAAIWVNDSGKIQSIGWIKAGDNTNMLSPNDYIISGNKIVFYTDSNLFSNVGNEYQVIASTVHVKSNTPVLTNTYVDEAEYDYNPHSSAGPGNNNDEMGMPFLSGALFFGIVIAWVIVWIFVGFWTYEDAQKRGMDSPIIWFLVVFLLEIIGLIIYLVIRPKEMKNPNYKLPPPPPS